MTGFMRGNAGRPDRLASLHFPTHSAHSSFACANTVFTASSCKSGGYPCVVQYALHHHPDFDAVPLTQCHYIVCKHGTSKPVIALPRAKKAISRSSS